ncbi:MAG: endonuclease V [bacterium]
MIACMDTFYKDMSAVAACILFSDWTDKDIIRQFAGRIEGVKPYEPGRFYKRELPCLLHVLDKIVEPIDIILIDGYVWLDGKKSPGLGAYLYETLGRSTPVIGVGKSRFKHSGFAQKVYRGKSKRPLYITSVGIDPVIASGYIRKMHGDHRIPTMLRKVDQLCRFYYDSH